MAKKISKDYFGLNYAWSIILAIIPVTNIIFGIIIRASNGNVLGVILNILLFPVVYIIDLVCIIAFKQLTFLV